MLKSQEIRDLSLILWGEDSSIIMLMKKNVLFIGWWQEKLWGNIMVCCQTLSSVPFTALLQWSEWNVVSCLTLFFSTSPDIIDNSKLITEECRKKVNGKHTSCLFVVQTTAFIPGCSVPALWDVIFSNPWSSEISLTDFKASSH